jgi:hypothetical protein
MRGLMKIIGNLTHLSLYPMLVKAYSELAEVMPERRVTPSDRLNGNGRHVEGLIFEQMDEEPEAPAQPAAQPKRGGKKDDRAKYLSLRESVPAGVLRIYDALAPVFRAHSRQPRSDKDWKGLLSDLQAVNHVAQNTRGIAEKLPAAFRAIFSEAWDELEYCRSGNGRIETISGLTAKWSDGTMKAIAHVQRYEAALRARGESPFDTAQGKAELAEERNRLIAEYNALKEAGAGKQEMDALRERIKELGVKS